MKSLTSISQAAVVLIAISTVSQPAFAARTFSSLTASPNSASVSTGVASTNTATVSVVNGSGASTRFVGPAQLTATVSPAQATITATFNPTNLTFPNANTTNTSILTVTTTAATPAGTYSIKYVADTNNPFAGDNVTPVTNTFTLNIGAVFIPQKVWVGGGGDSNWTTAGNWNQSGAPISSNDVEFFDTDAAGAPGAVDNIVNSNFTIGSLTYGQTNNSHTTLIQPGITLTIGGDANGLNAGTGTDTGDGQLVVAGMTGAGATLAATNQNSMINISQSHVTANNAIAQAQATLDLSTLDSFSATVSRVLVGTDISIKGASGVLKLAKTNSIALTTGSAAPQIDVGDNTQASGSPAIPSMLLLGQSNSIVADSIAVGRGKTDNTGGTMVFNNIFSTPSALFRGTNGASSRIGNWTIGDGSGSRTYYAYGTCDFSAGTVNALVDTMFVGKGANTALGNGANNPGFGTLTIGVGTFDINTLEVGYSVSAAGNGTVNVDGGSLLVNTFLELAHGAGSTGTLSISNGIVTANSGITAGGGTTEVFLNDATLNVTNSSATVGSDADPLESVGVTNSTLGMAVQASGPTVATMNIAAGGSANTINISSVPLLTGFPSEFPLIQYGLNGGTVNGDLTTFVLGTLPGATPAYSAYITNNAANNSIDIVLTSGPSIPSLTWDGTPNGNWDTNTTNWRTKSGPDTSYANGDFVTFDDSLTGTPNVNLTTAVSPASVTINNSSTTYLFSGTGKISGSSSLIKAGTGTLTLAETGGDDFAGGIIVTNGMLILDNPGSVLGGNTTIQGGTVQVGNNDANGLLPAGNVNDGGTLIFDHANNLVVANPISGTGVLMQNGNSILILSGNSSFTGAATVNQGTLQVGSTNGLGLATSVAVENSATFDVGGQSLFGNGNSNLVVTAIGAGVAGNGAIVNSGASQTKVLHSVTLAGDTTFGGTGDWDIRNSTGNSAGADASLTGAFNLTKVGTNTVSFRGVTVDFGLGNLNVFAGGLTFTATASAPLNSLGNSSSTATVFSNATLTLDTIGTIPPKNFVLTNGGILKCSGTNIFGNPLLFTGAANNGITVGSGAQFTITSVITGGGGFTKNGTNALFLTANNTYNGSTVVSGGTLALYGNGSDGSITSSVNINVTSGATLDVSGRSDGTLTLVSGQTLNGGAGTNGAGFINGSLVASLGANLAPGTAPTNTGTLTVSSNVVLQGTTTMKLNAASNTCDRLAAYSIAYGGALIVTNIQGSFTNGQTFQLFSASNNVYTAGTFSSITLPAATGLSWINSLATNGSIIAGVVTAPPARPVITSVTLSGNSLVIRGSNGTSGLQFEILTSTNAATPLNQWKSISTNTFSSGNFVVTNSVNPSAPQNFYLLRVP